MTDQPNINGVTPTTSGFEKADDGSVIASTPGAIAMYQLLSLAHQLGLEINTGMKMHAGVSPMQAANQLGLTKKRTKVGALKDVVAAIKKVDPDYTPRASIAKALGE